MKMNRWIKPLSYANVHGYDVYCVNDEPLCELREVIIDDVAYLVHASIVIIPTELGEITTRQYNIHLPVFKACHYDMLPTDVIIKNYNLNKIIKNKPVYASRYAFA